jgi:imidazoleglycerol-phosphate dehydratase
MGSNAVMRWAALARDTNETKIQLALNLDGGDFPPDTDSRLFDDTDSHASQASKSQKILIDTGIGFLDHMLHALAKHSGWSLVLKCQGDLHSSSLLRTPQPVECVYHFGNESLS